MAKNIAMSLIHFILSRKYSSIISATSFLFLTGTLFFHFTEGWSWFDSFYFCVITLATVGYGDLTPETTLGKAGVIVYILVGIGTFVSLIESYNDHVKEQKQKAKVKKVSTNITDRESDGGKAPPTSHTKAVSETTKK